MRRNQESWKDPPKKAERRRGVRSKTAPKSREGARLCLKGQSQQHRKGRSPGMNPRLGLRACCGWVFDHSRAPNLRFGSPAGVANRAAVFYCCGELDFEQTHPLIDMKREFSLGTVLGFALWLAMDG